MNAFLVSPILAIEASCISFT